MAGVPTYSKDNGVATNEFLYARDGSEQSDTMTVSSDTDVVAEDASGNQFLNKGWLMARITSGDNAGKWGPYDPEASDGRELLTNLRLLDTVCILKSNNRHVDCAAAGLYRAIVDASKVIVDGTQGAPSDEIQAAMPNIIWK